MQNRRKRKPKQPKNQANVAPSGQASSNAPNSIGPNVPVGHPQSMHPSEMYRFGAGNVGPANNNSMAGPGMMDPSGQTMSVTNAMYRNQASSTQQMQPRQNTGEMNGMNSMNMVHQMSNMPQNQYSQVKNEKINFIF